jgi:hypothetical protein
VNENQCRRHTRKLTKRMANRQASQAIQCLPPKKHGQPRSTTAPSQQQHKNRRGLEADGCIAIAKVTLRQAEGRRYAVTFITLRQTWKREKPTSAICVRNVDVQCVCNSHYFTQLAAFFIDPRAKQKNIKNLGYYGFFFCLSDF